MYWVKRNCRKAFVSVAIALIVTKAPSASAVLLYNSLGSHTTGGETDSAAPIHNFPSLDDLQDALPFQIPAGQVYTLDNIELNVAARSSSTQHLKVSITRDSAGAPGSIVDSLTVTDLPVRLDDLPLPVFPLTSTGLHHPTLTEGTYWLVLSTPDLSNSSEIAWEINDLGIIGTFAQLSTLNSPDWATP